MSLSLTLIAVLLILLSWYALHRGCNLTFRLPWGIFFQARQNPTRTSLRR